MFLRQLEETVRLCEKALRDNQCVVIGLQSTGESKMQADLAKNNHKGEYTEFISIIKCVYKHEHV